MMSQMLLTHQVAQMLNRTPAAVRAMERAGRLRAVRVGHVRLFRRAEVQRLIAERRGKESGKPQASGDA